jgi:hypothetical protein
MLSVNPTLDADDIWSLMVQTARRSDLPSRGVEKWNVHTGWGLIDAGAAVREAAKLSPVDLVYGGFGRLFTLHTGYDSRLGLQGGGLTRITAYNTGGSQIGQITFSDANWRGRCIGVGTNESRVVMAREAEDGLIALDTVDPVAYQVLTSRAIPKDQHWRLANLTVGLDDDPRLLWKWEVAGTGPGWNATYYRLDRLAGSTLNTVYSTVIQPPALDFVARDMATDWYGNTYVLWQSFRTGVIQIRVYNSTLTAIITDSPVTVPSDPGVVHPTIGANSLPSSVVLMPAVSLSVTTDGTCYILFKSARGSHETWKWSRSAPTVWDANPTRARYTVDRYEVVTSPQSDKILWPNAGLYSGFLGENGWAKYTIFRQWAKSLAVNPVDNLPRVLTVREGRSAEIWHLLTAGQSGAFPYDQPGAVFTGTKTLLPAQNFP